MTLWDVYLSTGGTTGGTTKPVVARPRSSTLATPTHARGCFFSKLITSTKNIMLPCTTISLSSIMQRHSALHCTAVSQLRLDATHTLHCVSHPAEHNSTQLCRIHPTHATHVSTTLLPQLLVEPITYSLLIVLADLFICWCFLSIAFHLFLSLKALDASTQRWLFCAQWMDGNVVFNWTLHPHLLLILKIIPTHVLALLFLSL